MSILVEALTLVMRRTTLNASYPGGAEAMLAWLAEEDVQARWVVADEFLVAASFLTKEIYPVVDALIERGFLFSENDGNQDVLVVDALLGLPSHTSWLEWAPPKGEQFSVCWLAGTSPGELAIPEGHTPGLNAPMRANIRWDPDMIRLGAEADSEFWLNTRTGRVEVHPSQPLLTEPGPLMQSILDGLPPSVHGVRLTEGDAEELYGRYQVGSFSCTLRMRVFEDQARVETTLLLPIEIPRSHLGLMEALTEEVRQIEGGEDAKIDLATAAPCSYMSAIFDDLETPPPMEKMMDQMMEILTNAAQIFADRLREMAEMDVEGEHGWLRAAFGLEGSPKPVNFERHLSELLLDLEETGWARVRFRDLVEWLGEDLPADKCADRIRELLETAGLDSSGIREGRDSDWIFFTRESGEDVGRSWATEG